MLKQVNIDGTLYKIGDARFEGDNLAYIQVPESITIGTPLTDLAPVQKALDSTDGAMLYAPSLNTFFAPTASATPATSRIWASTTGDKTYQLKATLDASGTLTSAVVVEAPAGGVQTIDITELAPYMTGRLFTPITTPEAITLAEEINDKLALGDLYLDASAMGMGMYPFVVDQFSGMAIDDDMGATTYSIIPESIYVRIFKDMTDPTIIKGLGVGQRILTQPDYVQLYKDSKASTERYISTNLAKGYGVLLEDLHYRSNKTFTVARGNLSGSEFDGGFVANSQYKPWDSRMEEVSTSNYEEIHVYRMDTEHDVYVARTSSTDPTPIPVMDIEVYLSDMTVLGIKMVPRTTDESAFVYDLMELMTKTGSSNFYTFRTDTDALTLGQDIMNHIVAGEEMGVKDIYIETGYTPFTVTNSDYDKKTTSATRIVELSIAELLSTRIKYTTDSITGKPVVNGVLTAKAALIQQDYHKVYADTLALTTLYINSDYAREIGVMLEIYGQPDSGNSGLVLASAEDNSGGADAVTGAYVITKSKTYIIEGTSNYGFIHTYSIPAERGSIYSTQLSESNPIPVPIMDIEVYVHGDSTGYGVVDGIKMVPRTTDHVVVAKEYMEVPTGHASHPCLEASVSGTTLNITHKNESHISSVIHVPKSVLFTSDGPFQINYAINSSGVKTEGVKVEVSQDGLHWSSPWNGKILPLVADTFNPELGKYSVFIKSDDYVTTDVAKTYFERVSGDNITVSGILNAMWGGKPLRVHDCEEWFMSMHQLVDASELIFPNEVTELCYDSMFMNCDHLKKAPRLPATTLDTECYFQMFNYCRALEEAPVLPAMNLAEGCYEAMFAEAGIKECPALPATVLAKGCYENMFFKCPYLTSTPELPATVLAVNCYKTMFQLCLGLTAPAIFPEITTMAAGAMQSMFEDCANIKWEASGEPYIIKTTDGSTETTYTAKMFRANTGTLPEGSGSPKLNTTYYLDI